MTDEYEGMELEAAKAGSVGDHPREELQHLALERVRTYGRVHSLPRRIRDCIERGIAGGYFSQSEAARILGVSRQSVSVLLRDGDRQEPHECDYCRLTGATWDVKLKAWLCEACRKMGRGREGIE